MMADIPNVLVIDCSTGEETYRPMNGAELAQLRIDQLEPASEPSPDPISQVAAILAAATDPVSGFAALQDWAKQTLSGA